MGQSAVEEVDYETRVGAKGANFGWPEYEGNQVHDPSRPGPDPPRASRCSPTPTRSAAPAARSPAATWSAIRDSALSRGRYLYADFYVGDIHSFVPRLGGATDDRDTGLHVPYLSSFGRGLRGRMYVASLKGPLYRLSRSN